MSSRFRLLTVAALIAVATAGYLVSQVLLPSPHPGPSVRVRVAGQHLAAIDGTTTDSVVAAPSSADEGGRSLGGPVEAAASYLDLLDGSDPAPGRIAALRAVTVAPLTARVTRAVPVIAELRARMSRGGPGLMEGWLLGWRVTSLTSDRARVEIWTTGVVAGPTVGVTSEWSTTTCSLVSSNGAWRVSDARTAAGPTPPSPGAGVAQATAFVRAASRFTVFGDAS
jgi:hypothetical protein